MEVFTLLKMVFTQAVKWSQSIPVLGTNLFVITLGFMAVTFVVSAIRFLFGGTSGGDK